jgi:hypothetical protein
MKLWKVLIFLSVMLGAAVLVVVSCSKSSSSNNNNNPGTASWTIMNYGAGNNNLDESNNGASFIVQDVQDMEKVGSQTGLNIVAMVASWHGGGHAKYYHIEYHPNENPNDISSPMLEDKGSKDMSDPATLKEFINYCKAHYPAQHYLLVIDDHGAGWPGSCSDEINGAGGLLSMPELRRAISESDLQHVDIVTFHACLMAMVEVAYELKDVASYMTACQFTMPMQNVLGADLWLTWLKNNATATPADLAHKVAENVRQAAENKQKTNEYGMINLAYMQNLGAKIGNFGNLLVTEGGQYWSEVQDAWGQTHTTQYDNPAYVDLREFCNKVLAETHLGASNLIRSQADSIIATLNAAVPYIALYFYPPDPTVPRGGLNIHFPFRYQDFDSINYTTLLFRSTNWHAFLSTFLANLGQQPPTGRCCYGNNQCGVGTQAECAQVQGTWTQGGDCSGANPCGGGNPTGRCCYNNNANCTEDTQAECTQLNGQWTQGLNCTANPCQGGGNCSTQCAAPVRLTLGVPVTNCSFTQTGQWHWFVVGVTSPHTFHFVLNGFAGGADFDLFTYVQCSDYPNTPFGCSSEAVGPEDFNCQITSGSGDLLVAIRAFQGTGAYSLTISQIGEPGVAPSSPAGSLSAIKH